MKYILFIVGFTAITFFSFKSHKCEHIYVQVEQPEIETIAGSQPAVFTDKKEGPELVCIKCYDTRRQIVKWYGTKHRLDDSTTIIIGGVPYTNRATKSSSPGEIVIIEPTLKGAFSSGGTMRGYRSDTSSIK